MRHPTWLLLLAACAASQPAAAPHPRAPMTVEWVAQEAPAGQLALIARVRRYTSFAVPVAVTVTVPDGLRVVSGRTSFAIAESEPPGTTDEPLLFEVVQQPAQDLLLEADARGADFGVHAKRAWSFGARAAGRNLVAPPAKGPALDVGDRHFGPSIPAH